MTQKPDDTNLLGGQEIWEKHNQTVSTKLAELGMTSEEVTQILSSDQIHDKIVQLCFASRPGAKSATTPEIAKHIPKGWSVKEDVPLTLNQFLKLKFISFLEKSESSIGRDQLTHRAKKLRGNFGLADAAWLLENQHLIPAELRVKYIVFPGTVLRGSDGDPRVPCLRWGGDDRLVTCKEELGS